MVGRQGMNSATVGARNRNRIIMELGKQPTHFNDLKVKLRLSAVSLTGHLGRLLEEGLIKREVEGRKIVYVVVEEKKKQTVLDLRKKCWNELALLIFDYDICLNEETRRLFGKVTAALKESYLNPEKGVEKLFVGKLKIKTKKSSEK